VVAALDRVRPGLAGRVSPLLGPPSPRSFEGLVTAVINELAADPGPDEVLLVLDDYHLVSSAQVDASVAVLLENLPPGLHVVVSRRSDPPLPLAPAAAPASCELRAADLRLPRGGGSAAGRDGRAGPAAAAAGWWPVPRGGRRGCS
jgi:LuxR family maltose regulon positive regulatory protein